MAMLRRKWATTAAVWLPSSALVLVWLVWKFDTALRPLPFSSLTPSDDDLRHVFENLHNSSWFNSSAACREFLQEGAADYAIDPITNVVRTQLGAFEWKGGEWFYPFESSNFLGHGGGGDHDAAFSAYQVTDANIGVQWGNLSDLVQTFGGRLILKNLWSFGMATEFYSASEKGASPAIDYEQVQDLKVLLHGAFVDMGVDRRVCMTGCAFRFDHPFERDCGFVLKMTYPNRPTLEASRVEAELSSARGAQDPLHFPAFWIMGPRNSSEYEYRSEKLLQMALNMSSNGSFTPSTSDPEDLVSYLERSGVPYYAVVAPNRPLIRKQGKVVVGPFTAPCSSSQEPFPAHPFEIELCLRFKNVATKRNSSEKILVSGAVKVDLTYGSYLPLVEQRPVNVEGIWDPASNELCMIGGTETWKLCVKSVLRRDIYIDSPLEDAVLSSLNGQFSPLRLLRGEGNSYPYVQDRPDLSQTARLASLTTYRYTVAAKAEDLAKTMTREGALDRRWFHPPYPTPHDVPDLCRATEAMRDRLSGFRMGLLYDAGGMASDVFLNRFEITYLESCAEGFAAEFRLLDAPLTSPAPGSYLRVAARLDLSSMSTNVKYSPWQSRAEGVYEPFTGQMHLVMHTYEALLAADPWSLQRNGGGMEPVQDHEIYVNLQFPSVDTGMTSAEEEALDPDPTYSHQGEYGHRFKVNMRIQSLRPPSDPLHFKPLVVRNYPLYKPSP